jgi:hypothetical protein
MRNKNMAIHNAVADDEKKFYNGPEGILDGYSLEGTQLQSFPESILWSWRLMASSWRY